MKVSLLIALLFVSPLLTNVVHADDEQQNHLLLIGIDGLRPDALAAAKTPNLDALIQQGSYTDQADILPKRYDKNDTISGPGWSNVLTGVWPDKHGVHDNSFNGRNYKLYPHFFTHLKRFQPEAMTVSLVSWTPIQKFIVSDADIAWAEEGDDQTAANKAVELLTNDNPVAMVVYLGGEVDNNGHTFGFSPSIPEYIQAIERTDNRIGAVLNAMKARPNYEAENWLVIVITDHGGINKTHGSGHNIPEIRKIPFIVSGPAAAQGTFSDPIYQVDAVATALTHLLGSYPEELQLDGKAVGLKPVPKRQK